MSCACDYETPSVCSSQMRRARKPHRCDECRRTIEPGELYQRTWGVWDGEPDSFKACGICIQFRDYVLAHVPCFCWAYGNVIVDGLETLAWNAQHCPGLFFGGARLVVQARRMRAAQSRGAVLSLAER